MSLVCVTPDVAKGESIPERKQCAPPRSGLLTDNVSKTGINGDDKTL
jgi:hypothetical protein